MKYLYALPGILCLIILLPSCQKSYVDNIRNENPVIKLNKAGVTKSSIDTFLVFSDTSALISTMADLENQSDSVLAAFEDSYSFVSMRKFYEDKLDNATDTFEQNRWEDRPVEMNEFATVVSPSGLIQLEDTLYLVDVEGGALYFTQNISSTGISLLKSKAVSDPAIDSVHLGSYSLFKKCDETQASSQKDNLGGWQPYISSPQNYRYKAILSYWDYGLWHVTLIKFKHRKWNGQIWTKYRVMHYFTYDYTFLKPRCRENSKTDVPVNTSTKNIHTDQFTIYSRIRPLHKFDISANNTWTHPITGNNTTQYRALRIKYP